MKKGCKSLALMSLMIFCNQAISQDEIFVSGFEAVPELFLDASPEFISPGESSTITWSVIDADSCNKSGAWSGIATAGTGIYNEVVMPISLPSTYSMQCSNLFGNSPIRTVVIGEEVNMPPLLTFVANPTTIVSGQTVTLNWNTTNATDCTASSIPANPSWSGARPTVGTFGLSGLNKTTTFTMTCTNDFGSVMKSVTVNVNGSTNCDSNQPPFGTSAFTGLTTFGDAMGSEFGNFTNDTAVYSQPVNFYSALSFMTPPNILTGRLNFVPPPANYSSASSTSVSISECPGDFNPDSTSNCAISFGMSGTFRWSTNQSSNPQVYCILEPTKSYFLNIIHAPLQDLSNSSCNDINGCGLLFNQTAD
ncbi:MAG: hypothetical protein R3E90_06065 [Marinicella sp.]